MLSLTIDEALRRASFNLKKAEVEDAAVEAEILLSYVLKTDRLQLYLRRQDLLPRVSHDSFLDLVERRSKGEPFAYITGHKYFYGRSFRVDRRILIPRPETELIVERSLLFAGEFNKSGAGKLSILDLGTGSGVLAVTLALEIIDAEVWAVDLSPEALEIARLNANENKVNKRIAWLEGDYFNAVEDAAPGMAFNLIVSNPPYLSESDMEKLPPGIKEYEPVEALYGGLDGLDGYRQIIEKVPHFMETPFKLIVEIGSSQEEEVIKIFKAAGLFSEISCYPDLAGLPRIVEATSLSLV